MLRTPAKFPSIKTDLATYFLRAIHAAPWSIVSAGRERRFRADQLDDLMHWVSAQQMQQQGVGLWLDPAQHLIVTAPAVARPAEMSMPPTHVVFAGGLWLIWRLTDAISSGDARRATAALAKQLRGGAAANNMPVPLPGTVALSRRGVQLVGKHPVQTLPPLPFSYRFVSGRLERPTKNEHAVEESIACRADEIKARPIEWLWPGVIPLGSLTLIAGAAGMGKSQVAISIAAKVTREGGRALIMEAEDDAGSVVLPRLKASGADVKKCAIGSLADLSHGIKTLTATAKTLGGVRLVVLSPIRAFFKAAEDHGNVGVRKALAPLLKWAANNGVTIIGIGHPPKGRRDPFAGSQAYVEVARAAWSVVSDPADKNPIKRARRRVMVAEKCNLAPDIAAIGYSIEGARVDDIETSKVIWND